MIHCKCSTWQPKHHNWEETCHISTCDTFCTFTVNKFSYIINTSYIKPEHVVQCMVKPCGINRRLKKPYSPAPVAFKLLINSPNDTSQPYTTGHTKNNTAAAPTMAVADIIGARRFPLKNAKASGS